MEHLIHYMLSLKCEQPYSFKFPNLFLIFPIHLQIYNWDFLSIDLMLYLLVFSNLTKKFWDFRMLLSYYSWTSQFFPIHEKDKEMSFSNINLRCTSNFFHNSLNWEFENWDCEVLLITYFVRLWGVSFKRSMFVEKRGKHNLWLNCQFFKKNSHI